MERRGADFSKPNAIQQNNVGYMLCHLYCLHCISPIACMENGRATRRIYADEHGDSIVLTLLGVTGICLSAFRSKISARVKVYLGCLFFTCAAAYMLIFHPYYETRRMPYPMNIVVCTVACIFFGGGGLWILNNDCRWYWKRRNKNKRKSS